MGVFLRLEGCRAEVSLDYDPILSSTLSRFFFRRFRGLGFRVNYKTKHQEKGYPYGSGATQEPGMLCIRVFIV